MPKPTVPVFAILVAPKPIELTRFRAHVHNAGGYFVILERDPTTRIFKHSWFQMTDEPQNPIQLDGPPAAFAAKRTIVIGHGPPSTSGNNAYFFFNDCQNATDLGRWAIAIRALLSRVSSKDVRIQVCYAGSAPTGTPLLNQLTVSVVRAAANAPVGLSFIGNDGMTLDLPLTINGMPVTLGTLKDLIEIIKTGFHNGLSNNQTKLLDNIFSADQGRAKAFCCEQDAKQRLKLIRAALKELGQPCTIVLPPNPKGETIVLPPENGFTSGLFGGKKKGGKDKKPKPRKDKKNKKSGKKPKR